MPTGYRHDTARTPKDHLVAMRCEQAHNPAVVAEGTTGAAVGERRVRIDLAYDGSFFSGWAAQPHLVTVQGMLEDALELVLRTRHRVTVAGRTDAGVHAEAQTVHLDIAESTWARLTGGGISAEPAHILHRRLAGALRRTLRQAEATLNLPKSLHGVLQGAVRIDRVVSVPNDFDARFSAIGRRYVYRIDDGQPGGAHPLRRAFTWAVAEKLDCDELNTVAAELVGLRDFLSFCKPREGASTIRHLHQLYCARTTLGVIEVRVIADAFCHHMVRSLVGALVLYGTGQRTIGWLRELITEPRRDASLVLAPAQGLSLAEIYYPDATQYAVQAVRARSRRAPGDLEGARSRGEAE